MAKFSHCCIARGATREPLKAKVKLNSAGNAATSSYILSSTTKIFPSQEFYLAFPDRIYDATGFSLPFGAFGIEHYDMHFYTTPREEQLQQICVPALFAPICDPAIPGPFFDFDTALDEDMPDGFTCELTAAIPQMGIHCWDFDTNPDTPQDWKDPVFVMGAYDDEVAFFEPMVPLTFVTGDEDNSYEEAVDVAPTLPFRYSVEYKAATGRTTVTLSGVHSKCGESV